MKNRAYLLDAGERVVWTLLQCAAGAFLDVATSGELTWRAVLYAAGLSLAKVIVARKVGDSNTAQALPGVESTYTTQPANKPAPVVGE